MKTTPKNHLADWYADGDAWGLTATEFCYHLTRLSQYYRRIEAYRWQRYERTKRWEALALTIFGASLAVSLLLWAVS